MQRIHSRNPETAAFKGRTHWRPTVKLLARIGEVTHRNYRFRVRVGVEGNVRRKWFKTWESAKEYADTQNTPEKLVRAFRKYFTSERETLAFLGLPTPESISDETPPAVPAQALTVLPQKSSTYMSSTPFRVKRSNRPGYKFVVRGKEGGKYTRRFFERESEAKTYADGRNMEARNQGIESLEMPSWLRIMALRCQSRLEPFKQSLDDATTFFVKHLESEARSRSFSALIREVVEDKVRKGFQRCHARQLCRATCALLEFVSPIPESIRAKRLAPDAALAALIGLRNARVFAYVAAAPPVSAAAFTTSQIDSFLASQPELSPTSLNGLLRLLRTTFEHALRNGYISRNPAKFATYYKSLDSPVGILQPEELDRLLRAAQGTALLPYFAIGAFAGLRVAEILRLDWKEVDFESGFIEVTALKSKTATRRLVRIQPVLREWLAPHFAEKGPVVNMASRTLHQSRAAILQKAEITEWPHNALRHSFASYHLAKFNDAPALALEMGHATTAMIFLHYRQVVRPSRAEIYWQIRPELPKNLCQFSPNSGESDPAFEGEFGTAVSV